MTAVTLERVVRPNETVPTPYGTGYYTYIQPKVDNTEIADTVMFVVEANTSTQTTTISGESLSWDIKAERKDKTSYKEIQRQETTVDVKDSDDVLVARYAALKQLSIKDPSGNVPTYTIKYAHPSRDGKSMIPAGGTDTTKNADINTVSTPNSGQAPVDSSPAKANSPVDTYFDSVKSYNDQVNTYFGQVNKYFDAVKEYNKTVDKIQASPPQPNTPINP